MQLNQTGLDTQITFDTKNIAVITKCFSKKFVGSSFVLKRKTLASLDDASFDYLSDIDSVSTLNGLDDVVISLPKTLPFSSSGSCKDRRLTLVVYRTSSLFQEDNFDLGVNESVTSVVISARLGNNETSYLGENPVELKFPMSDSVS